MTEGQYLLRKKGPQAEIARRCGVTKAAVSLWMRGDASPGIASRKAIARVFPDITFDSWDREIQTARRAAG